ncbi:MAG: NifB/NifX family molybdenum-iron cluster-binding protein [Dehalococcoidaceae bacterium]|nr:NifB/NifX family molybdenum-iron cluster-binding protein [Dehalococcoidaceae bacterium]
MKYALPLNDGKVSAHFGHCEQFALVEADPASKTILSKEFLTPPPHQPGLLPVWLAEKGANVILAGGMGAHARELFLQNNITVVTGVDGLDPEKAVLDYLADSLELGADSCDHTSGQHTCNH